MKRLHVIATLQEELLGTASADPEIHNTFVAQKSANKNKIEEETDALPDAAESGVTVFPRDDKGNPILWDYQIKGFFKDACGVLRTIKGKKSEKVRAYKKLIDGRIFVEPRKIPITTNPYPDSSMIGSCQRPLRGQTPQGERIALACSETVNEGSVIEFDVVMLSNDDEAWVRELLDYGKLRGLGQWRNSGKGRFVAEIQEVENE